MWGNSVTNRYMSKATVKLSLSALLVALCQPALAQTTSQDATTCATIENDGTRLACYDGLFRSKPEQADKGAKIAPGLPESPTPSKPQQPKADIAPSQDDVAIFGKREEYHKKVNIIHVEITEAYRDVYGKWVFITTNSQVWRQSDIKRATIPSLPAKATIKRGAMGSFMLKFEDRNRSIRVKRRN